MALDFPTTLKLREEEHRVVLELVEREPLLSRAEAVIGVFIMGARIAREGDGFQELLRILRQRRQGGNVIAARKPAQSERKQGLRGSPASVPGRCA